MMIGPSVEKDDLYDTSFVQPIEEHQEKLFEEVIDVLKSYTPGKRTILIKMFIQKAMILNQREMEEAGAQRDMLNEKLTLTETELHRLGNMASDKQEHKASAS
jgi:hypothetical protein